MLGREVIPGHIVIFEICRISRQNRVTKATRVIRVIEVIEVIGGTGGGGGLGLGRGFVVGDHGREALIRAS